MQLHRLVLRAIGPFADEYVIDFDRVGASGLFLLEGPTGAGKSSIIDAIVFALYGQVAGRHSSIRRMHSDFADRGVTPYVELDFSTSAGLYRVRRTPKFERPKKRGDGVTTVNATAKLWRLISADAKPTGVELGEAISTRVEEASDEITRLIGLNRAQFVQTMVLPQGEFAQFLRAPIEERRELLQRLFGTVVFEQIQTQLEDMCRAAQQARADAIAGLRETVGVFAGAASLPLSDREQFLHATQSPDQLRLLIDGTLSDQRAADEVLTTQLSQAQDLFNAADQHRQQATELDALRQRKQRLIADRAELEHGKPDVERARVTLADDQRARRVAPLLEAWRTATGLATVARQACAAARESLSSDVSSLGLLRWQSLEQQLIGEIATVKTDLALEDQLAELVSQATQRRGDEQLRRGALTDIDNQLELIPRELSDLDKRHVAAVDASAALPQLRDACHRSRRVEAAAGRVATLKRQVKSATASLQLVRQQALLAQEREHELRIRLLSSTAAELASQLAVGAPCQVCGSTSHPHIAQRRHDDVQRGDVDSAEADRRTAVEELEIADQVAKQAEIELVKITTQADGCTAAQARRRAAAAETALTEAELAAADVEIVGEKLGQLRAQHRRLNGERTQCQLALTTAAKALARSEQQVEVLTARLASSRANFNTVAERVASLEADRESLTKAINTHHQLDAAERTEAQALDAAHALARDNCFDELDAVVSAMISDDDRGDLERSIKGFDDAVAGVQAQLAAPELTDVDETLRVDLEPFVIAAETAKTELDVAQRRSGVAHSQLQSAAAAAESVFTALTHQREQLRSTEPVIRMANLVTANGADNARGMTLATFVLVQRFTDVVSAANERLALISDGRYELQHVEDRSGNKRAGLGLLVFDSHTERVREPGTLSGGETFYCSLALALGLADIVSAEAGGISLATLFVDEGFGSLDAQTLDQVLDVLSQLSKSGRTVGLVSHVGELKERISEQVVVSKMPGGASRLHVVA